MPTVLITGASRGLGLEFARQYAADGWSVIATCRNPVNVGELGRIEGDIAVYSLDVLDPNSIARLATDLKGRPIDLLINNAGIYGPRGNKADDVEEAEWIKVMRTNVMAPLFVARALHANLAAGEGKKLVNISSQMGSISKYAAGSEYIYRTSKAALNMTMACYANEVAADGFTVMMFHPGWVQTDMGGPSASLTPTESVTAMRGTIARLTTADNGTFKNYDGAPFPW